jgi:putative autoinducer-2 (AI-2) aldolase
MDLAYNAIQRGAAGVDMGRNIFQSEAPGAMMQAIHKVVHNGFMPKEAYELFLSLKSEEAKAQSRWCCYWR